MLYKVKQRDLSFDVGKKNGMEKVEDRFVGKMGGSKSIQIHPYSNV